MFSRLPVCIVLAFLATTGSASANTTPVTASGKNIVQLAQSVPDLSTLVTALVAGGLTGALSGTGPFTVFAPTNEAFGKVPADVRQMLGLPAMGGIGCGWATSISNGVAALALLIYLNRSAVYRRFHLLADWAKPDAAGIRYILRLGIPIGFTIFVTTKIPQSNQSFCIGLPHLFFFWRKIFPVKTPTKFLPSIN
jgi:hypothetical protein